MCATTTRSPRRGGPVRVPRPLPRGDADLPMGPRSSILLPPAGSKQHGRAKEKWPAPFSHPLDRALGRRSVNVRPPGVSIPPEYSGVRSAPRPSPRARRRPPPNTPQTRAPLEAEPIQLLVSRSEGHLRYCAPRARKNMGHSDRRSAPVRLRSVRCSDDRELHERVHGPWDTTSRVDPSPPVMLPGVLHGGGYAYDRVAAAPCASRNGTTGTGSCAPPEPQPSRSGSTPSTAPSPPTATTAAGATPATGPSQTRTASDRAGPRPAGDPTPRVPRADRSGGRAVPVELVRRGLILLTVG